MAQIDQNLAFDLDNGPTPPPMPPVPLPVLGIPIPSVLGTALGDDIAAYDDLNPQMILLGGNANLGQALAHRLTTPTGSLFYDANYGLDTRQFLEETVDYNFLQSCAMQVQQQIQLDERVVSSTVNVTFDLSQDLLTIQMNVTSTDGPFVFVLAVTSLTVTLLSPDSPQA